jgi:sulfoxide reductase heme-binding subunit YedZ
VKGPKLLVGLAVAIAAMCGGIVAGVGATLEGAHAVVRWTARVSLVLFALAYVARPLAQVRPGAAAKWLLRERKWIGLAFATSHAFHLAGILAIASPDFGAFVRAQPPTNAVAATTFVLLFAMAITSVDVIKAKLAPRAWKALHRTGMHFAWISFAATYAGAVAKSPWYAIPAAIVFGAGTLRLTAFIRQRGRARRKVEVTARAA